jgi:hypothetical protein
MMINDPGLQACPCCGQSWAEHRENCRYYSPPQPRCLCGRDERCAVCRPLKPRAKPAKR